MIQDKIAGVLAGIPRISGWVLSGAAACAALLPYGAGADTVTLDGSGAMTYSFQYVAPNSTTPTVGDDYDLAVPGLYTFTDTFTTQQSLTQNLGTSSVGAYDFQDSYRFTVGSEASGDTLLASLGLGSLFNITNLQFRLYEVASSTTQPIVGGVPPLSNVISPWVGPGPGNNSMTVSFTGIQSGTYILDVAGIASGTGGGSYIGSMDLEPVPLPAALPLLLSGLGGLGLWGRRRRGG